VESKNNLAKNSNIVCLKMIVKLLEKIFVAQTDLLFMILIKMELQNVPEMMTVKFGRIIGTINQIKNHPSVDLTS